MNEAAQVTRKSNDEARSEAERRQKTVVAALAEGLGRLAKRDLTSRLEEDFPPEYEQIRADFNATAESLNQAMRTIIEATVSIDFLALTKSPLPRTIFPVEPSSRPQASKRAPRRSISSPEP